MNTDFRKLVIWNCCTFYAPLTLSTLASHSAGQCNWLWRLNTYCACDLVFYFRLHLVWFSGLDVPYVWFQCFLWIFFIPASGQTIAGVRLKQSFWLSFLQKAYSSYAPKQQRINQYRINGDDGETCFKSCSSLLNVNTAGGHCTLKQILTY